MGGGPITTEIPQSQGRGLSLPSKNDDSEGEVKVRASGLRGCREARKAQRRLS